MRILGYAFSRFFTAFSVQRVLNFKRAAVLRSKMLTQVQHYEIWRFRIDMVFSYRVAFRKTRPGISRVFTVKILSFASSLHSFGTGSSESMVEATTPLIYRVKKKFSHIFRRRIWSMFWSVDSFRTLTVLTEGVCSVVPDR